MSVKTITAKEIAKQVINGENMFILDVRNTGDFDDWKIEGKSVEVLNMPYFELLDGVDPVINHLPKDKPIYVVCAKGGSSEFVAEQIVEEGYDNVYSMENGMNGWSEYLEPIKIGDLDDGGEIYQFNRIGKGCLSYMVISNGEALVVDSVRMIDTFINFAKEKNVVIKHVADTHLHADHISGGRKLAEKTGATYYLPSKDAEEVVFDFTNLEDGKDIVVGNTAVKAEAIYSPGHTIGSTSFIVDNKYLLTGDILFVKSIGRPDLAGKAEDWVSDLRNSLYNLYANMSQDLIILPAHFGDISEMGDKGQVQAKLGDMFENNEGLNIQDEKEFRKIVSENLPPQPNAYQEIRQVNMGRITPSNEEQREMEIGPNRCAVHG